MDGAVQALRLAFSQSGNLQNRTFDAVRVNGTFVRRAPDLGYAIDPIVLNPALAILDQHLARLRLSRKGLSGSHGLRLTGKGTDRALPAMPPDSPASAFRSDTNSLLHSNLIISDRTILPHISDGRNGCRSQFPNRFRTRLAALSAVGCGFCHSEVNDSSFKRNESPLEPL